MEQKIQGMADELNEYALNAARETYRKNAKT